jgi:hypothetical protein
MPGPVVRPVFGPGRYRPEQPGGWYSYRPRPTRAVGCQNGSASPLKFVDVQNSPNLPNRGTMPASLALSLVALATSAQVLSAPL